MTLVMTSLLWLVFGSLMFALRADCGNLTAQSMESHKGIGGKSSRSFSRPAARAPRRACSQARGGVVPVQLFPDPFDHRLFCSVTHQVLNWLLQSNVVSMALLDSNGKTLRTSLSDGEAVLIFFRRLVLIFMLVFAR